MRWFWNHPLWTANIPCERQGPFCIGYWTCFPGILWLQSRKIKRNVSLCTIISIRYTSTVCYGWHVNCCHNPLNIWNTGNHLLYMAHRFIYLIRDYSVYGFSQWEAALQWKVVVSHWLSPYPEWYLMIRHISRASSHVPEIDLQLIWYMRILPVINFTR